MARPTGPDLIIKVLQDVAELRKSYETGFSRVDAQFARVDAHFQKLNAEFDSLRSTMRKFVHDSAVYMSRMEGHLEAVHETLVTDRDRLDELDDRVTALEHSAGKT